MRVPELARRSAGSSGGRETEGQFGAWGSRAKCACWSHTGFQPPPGVLGCGNVWFEAHGQGVSCDKAGSIGAAWPGTFQLSGEFHGPQRKAVFRGASKRGARFFGFHVHPWVNRTMFGEAWRGGGGGSFASFAATTWHQLCGSLNNDIRLGDPDKPGATNGFKNRYRQFVLPPKRPIHLLDYTLGSREGTCTSKADLMPMPFIFGRKQHWSGLHSYRRRACKIAYWAGFSLLR